MASQESRQSKANTPSMNPFSCLKQNIELTKNIANEHYNGCLAACEELAKLFPNLEKEISDQKDALSQNFENLQKVLKEPVIRIAALGTTSSGKSSLLNLFCGTELLPTGVQEKSAGITRIKAAETPGLYIEETKNALWTCGNYEINSAAEIRAILDAIMEMYRNAIKSGKYSPEDEPAAPSFIISWPLIISSILDLPTGFELELLDLPGLRYTGDERNRKIMSQCRNSLCMITFGSHETDPIKQDMILEDAIEQITAIDAPPERLFFVATRLDNFLLTDYDNWPKNEDDFIKERQNAIKERLREEFKDSVNVDNQSIIENPVLHRISPLPALRCLQLQDESTRLASWKHIDSAFRGLVTGGANRNRGQGVDLETGMSAATPATWSEQDWQKIIIQLLDTTHTANFISQLQESLDKNLDAIIFPPICAEYIANAREFHQWFNNFYNLALVNMQGRLEKHKALLKQVIEEEKTINLQAAAELNNFFNPWLANTFAMDNEAANSDSYKNSSFYSQTLKKIENWQKPLKDAFLKPISQVSERLISGIPFSQLLPAHSELEKACLKLMRYKYRGLQARDGMRFETVQEKGQEIKESFESLIQISINEAYKMTETAIVRLMEQFGFVLDEIQNAYLQFMQSHAAKLPDDLGSVATITPAGLKRFKSAKIARKEAALPGISLKNHERVEIIKKNNLLKEDDFLDIVINTWRKIKGEDTVTIIEKTNVTTGYLPAARGVIRSFESEFESLLPRIAKSLHNAAQIQIKEFLNNINNYQNFLFERYEKKLKESMDKNLNLEQAEEAKIQSIKNKLQKLEDSLTQFSKLYRQNTNSKQLMD